MKLERTHLDRKVNALAGSSLTLGLIGAVLTALAHWQISFSSHFDFVFRDTEYFLVGFFLLLITSLAVIDFRNGISALRHMNEPHEKYAKPMAIAGISIGMVDLVPALVLLGIFIQALSMQYMKIVVPFH